ncbi:MAG: alpha/beta fold hydrolase [Blastocatellia bacterium]|nr:alpha/beta fold hydrolase [Blastocatellia bacterium]
MTKEEIAEQLSQTPFIPHPALKNPHAQTIVSSLIRRRSRLLAQNTAPRYFDPSPGVRVLAHCSWQNERTESPTLLMLHGLEGSADSPYMIGIAEKAVAAGFNAIRLNMRNCGGTEHLTPMLYHAGLTEDLRRIIDELTGNDRLREIYLAGVSLGGNVALKLAGEYGRESPRSLCGVVAISPSLDLASCADAVELRSNSIYHLRFVLSLRSRLRRKARLFPDRYDQSRLKGIWTIRKFDDIYTAPHAGFRDSADYYNRASALPLINRISVPTLILHAKDDPLIPFTPFERREISENPNITLLATERGGHAGFISASADERFWAEAKAIEFIKLTLPALKDRAQVISR